MLPVWWPGAQTGSAGGYVKQADTNNFPVSGVAGMSGALVKLVPQGMREMHWCATARGPGGP